MGMRGLVIEILLGAASASPHLSGASPSALHYIAAIGLELGGARRD
jgi:hypothetical protein